MVLPSTPNSKKLQFLKLKLRQELKERKKPQLQIKSSSKLTAEGGDVLVYLMEYKAGYLYGVL